MVRKACKMKVFPGCYAEYRKRHDEIWPEMKEELSRHGYRNYSIFLDEQTGDLYSYFETDDEKATEDMANTAICRKWWHYMKDIMETNPDESPRSWDLTAVFHLN